MPRSGVPYRDINFCSPYILRNCSRRAEESDKSPAPNAHTSEIPLYARCNLHRRRDTVGYFALTEHFHTEIIRLKRIYPLRSVDPRILCKCGSLGAFSARAGECAKQIALVTRSRNARQSKTRWRNSFSLYARGWAPGV